MSSLIPEALWKSSMPNWPMPEGCTMEEFWAAEDSIKKRKDIKYAVDYIASLKEALTQPNLTQETINYLNEEIYKKAKELDEL